MSTPWIVLATIMALAVRYVRLPVVGEVARNMTKRSRGFQAFRFRRYQLGIPTWRALVGLTEIELEGVQYVHEADRTAVFIDARSPEEFRAGASGTPGISLSPAWRKTRMSVT